MYGLTHIRIVPSKLKEARLKRGISQAEAARRVGVARGQIWNYEQENVKGTPRADVLARLCRLYEVDISELTTGEPQAA